jgi:hypothetical protein
MTAVKAATATPATEQPATGQPATEQPATEQPATGQPAPGQPTAMMSGRYQRAFTVAVVFLVAGWHLAGAGGQLLHNRLAYASFAFQGAMWLVMALAIGAGSVLVLRGALGRRHAWAIAVIALAASTAAAAASPAGQVLAVNWAWGSAGWIGVLVLLRRRFSELACFLAATALGVLSV